MLNIGKRLALIGFALAAAGGIYATPASAQATRTWVSGVGDDVNPCSRTAPCKTFAGAISKTAAGGEINCIDPGGFGAVTITKSITIDCHYTEGGALAGGNGIVVNDGATATPNTAVVTIRGLDIFGVNPPTNGVRFVAGAALHIEDSVIRRFNAVNSLGVSFAPAASARLYISNTTITDNGNGATGGGIEINPGVGGSARAVLRGVRIRNNGQDGVRLNSVNGLASVVIEDSDISGNRQGMALSGGASAARAMVNNTSIANNVVVGIVTSGATAIARVGNSTITGNAQGVVAQSSSAIQSYGNNRLDGNPESGPGASETFSGPVAPK
ncbi:MAG TPA: right-handed parallel beta-helix repeat-containing protein [Allosphingosinicella sp.]|jgi:hypothetical protein